MDYSLAYFDTEDEIQSCGIMKPKSFKNSEGFNLGIPVECVEALLEIAEDAGKDWVNIYAFEKREKRGKGGGDRERTRGRARGSKRTDRDNDAEDGQQRRRRSRGVKAPPKEDFDDEIPF